MRARTRESPTQVKDELVAHSSTNIQMKYANKLANEGWASVRRILLHTKDLRPSHLLVGVQNENFCLCWSTQNKIWNTIQHDLFNSLIKKKLLYQTFPCIMIEHTISLASIIDNAMHVCFLLHKNITPVLWERKWVCVDQGVFPN